jgi:hypothetical protein
VQSVVVDPDNSLWALDTGSVDMGPVRDRARMKLVQIDLVTNQLVQTFRFPPEVAPPTTCLNDVRFDLRAAPRGSRSSPTRRCTGRTGSSWSTSRAGGAGGSWPVTGA